MRPSRIALGLLVWMSSTQADWLLNSYSMPTQDSARIRAQYGVESFHNPASVAKVEVSGGAVRLVASRIASDSTEGFSARVGIRHSLVPEGTPVDLLGVRSVDFEFRNTATITEMFTVSFQSDAYREEWVKAGTVYEIAMSGSAFLAASGDWKKVSLPIADFATPKWWSDIPAGFPANIDVVLKQATGLRFEPSSLYRDSGIYLGRECTKCVTPTMDSLTLEIRNIVLVGLNVDRPPNPERIGCTGESFVLDRAFDDRENEAGGYWFNLSDHDSSGTSTDKSKGKSTSSFTLVEGDSFASGFITLHAGLNKMNGTTWNPYAGWAAIGTGFFEGGWLIATGLTGIQFRLLADSLPAVVEGIRFKVGLKGVSDTATHSVMIPSSALKSGASGGIDVCVRPEDLKMPGHVAKSEQSDFDPAKGIRQMAWEVMIADKWDSTLTRADVKFSVGQVVLYGLELCKYCIPAVQPRSPSRPFAISYVNGALSLRGLVGIVSLDILALDGHRVASFAPSSRIPLRLARGTWILAAHRRDGTVATQPFVVAGP